VNYSTEGEYMRQRGSAEYWLGRAAQSGTRVVLPEQCTLLAEPALLYGYESHDEVTGKLKAAYQSPIGRGIVPLVPGQAVPELAKVPAHLVAEIAAEEAEYPRPSWALGPVRSDGQAQENA
jgi:hypothetical protein